MLRLGTRRFRHSSDVTAIAISQDWRMLATSASIADETTVWDAGSGERILDLPHPADSLAFSPDGRILAVALACVRLVDLATGRVLGDPESPRLRIGNAEVRSPVAFSPDGGFFAAVADEPDSDVVLATWPQVAPAGLVRGVGQVRAIAFAPDAGSLAVANQSGITFFAIPSRQGRSILEGREVKCVAFSPDGRWLACGARDGVHLVDLADPTIAPRVLSTRGSVKDVGFSVDGELLAASDWWSWVFVLHVPDGERVGKFKSTRGEGPLAFLADGRLAVARGNAVRFHEPREDRPSDSPDAHDGSISRVAVSPDARLVATASHDHSVIVWSLETGEVVRRLDGHDNAVLSVAFSPTGDVLVSGSADATIRFWNVADGRELRRVEGACLGIREVSALAFSPDGSVLASGGGDGGVVLRDPVDGQPREGGAARHADTVTHVAFGEDGSPISLGDGWLLGVHGLERTRFKSDALAISPDRRLLAISTEEDVVVWDLRSSREVRRFASRLTTSLAFSGDGLLACARFAGQPSVWELESGRPRPLPTIEGHPHQLAFVPPPDGRLVVGRRDGSAVVLEVPPPVPEPPAPEPPEAFRSEPPPLGVPLAGSHGDAEVLLRVLTARFAPVGYRGGLPAIADEGLRVEREGRVATLRVVAEGSGCVVQIDVPSGGPAPAPSTSFERLARRMRDLVTGASQRRAEEDLRWARSVLGDGRPGTSDVRRTEGRLVLVLRLEEVPTETEVVAWVRACLER